MAKIRARLGPASRAAMQLGATLTSRDMGTTPLTAPARGVGRLFGLIGLTSSAVAGHEVLLAADPVHRRLIPVPGLLMAAPPLGR